MARLKWIALVLAGYLGIVVVAESAVAILGARQAARGLAAGEEWLMLTTRDPSGAPHDTVVAGVEVAGALYVAANHWPRGWYERAIANPEISVARAGEVAAYSAVPIAGAERARVATEYTLPLAVRVLTGFPPRAFLRLDPL